MVGGFNTNVRYRGRTFHVQTEDSGPARPYVVTLVYEGGTILFSRKTEYSAGGAGPDGVRARMESQHRDILVELKSGRIDARLGFGEPDAIREFGEGVFTGRSLDDVIVEHLAGLAG